MSRGTPLTDDDRAPWLAAIAAWIDERLAAGAQRHRVLLGAEARLPRRDPRPPAPACGSSISRASKSSSPSAWRRACDHFMPPALLDSQFATLEEPAADERALVVPVSPQPGEVVAFILKELGLADGRSG